MSTDADAEPTVDASTHQRDSESVTASTTTVTAASSIHSRYHPAPLPTETQTPLPPTADRPSTPSNQYGYNGQSFNYPYLLPGYPLPRVYPAQPQGGPFYVPLGYHMYPYANVPHSQPASYPAQGGVVVNINESPNSRTSKKRSKSGGGQGKKRKGLSGSFWPCLSSSSVSLSSLASR